MSELRGPADFLDVLSDPAQPLIVGGQAVNLWAEVYAPTVPALDEFEPFTSKDADIHGNRELAQILHRRSGWACQFFDEVRQPAVAVLTKPLSGTSSELRIEVIRSVHGLTNDDLARNLQREIRAGQLCRIPDPLVLLKAKLANVAHLSNEKRPQDLKHARMLVPICRAYLLEVHSVIGRPDMTERNFLGAIAYLTEVIRSADAQTVTRRHSLDLMAVFPASLSASPHEKVRRFAEQQLPRIRRGAS